MNRAMYVAASGMAAQEAQLDAVADNLANADVAGFKGSMLRFRSIGDGSGAGLGTAIAAKQLVFRQGKLVKSGGPFDVAIDGTGFFVLRRADGTRAFTRDGEFSRNPDGSVRNSSGARLDGVHIPADALRVSVDTGGRVFVDTPRVAHAPAGRIGIAVFAAPERLQPVGDGTFAATTASGTALLVVPHGENGANSGRVMFGMLERSNVSVVESMMEILSAQRAFEANSKGVQAADEMLSIANNLQRNS